MNQVADSNMVQCKQGN